MPKEGPSDIERQRIVTKFTYRNYEFIYAETASEIKSNVTTLVMLWP